MSESVVIKEKYMTSFNNFKRFALIEGSRARIQFEHSKVLFACPQSVIKFFGNECELLI